MRLSPTRVVSLVALAASTLLPALASFADDSIDTLPRLAGTTTITATHSGSLRLVVPWATYLDLDRTKTLGISGSGRYLRFQLNEETGGDNLVFIRYPKAAGRSETFLGSRSGTQTTCLNLAPLPVPKRLICGQEGIGPFRLHSGVYRLRVIVDSSPVTFTLHTINLTGDIALSPTSNLFSRESDLADDSPIAGSAATGSGDNVPVDRILDSFFWWNQLPGAGNVQTACSYPTRDGVPTPVGPHWLPGCPGGQPQVYQPGTSVRYVGHKEHHTADVGGSSGAGAYSVGLSVTAAGLKDFGGFSVALEGLDWLYF